MNVSPGNQQTGNATGDAGRGGYLLDGCWRILPAENRIIGPGIDRRIPDKFMRVLEYLIEAPGVVTREELMESVWPDTVVVDEVLTRAVSELRKIFGDRARDSRMIETIPKRGYRLLAPVRPLAGDVTDDPVRTAAGRRGRWVPGVGAAVVVALSLTVWLSARTDEVSRITPRLEQLTSHVGVENFPALTPSGDRLAYVWEGDDTTPAGVFVRTVGGGEPLALTTVPGHYVYPAWTHDLRHVAYTRMTGDRPGLYMTPATGGDEILLVPMRHDLAPVQPAFSPDGRGMVFSAGTEVYRGRRLEYLDLLAGETKALTGFDDERVLDVRPRYSPSGDRLAFLRNMETGLMVALMPAGGGDIVFLPMGDRDARGLDWDENGEFLLISACDGLWQLDPAGGERRLINAELFMTGVSAARDRRLVAYSQAYVECSVWELPLDGLPESAPARPLITSSSIDQRPSLSPDGRRIVFASMRGGPFGLWTADRDGGDIHLVHESPRTACDAPAWSPDGRMIAFEEGLGTRNIVAVVGLEGGEPRRLTTGERHASRPRWSRDGRWIYLSLAGQDGPELWKHPRDGGDPVCVIPDGGWLGCESADGTRVLYSASVRDTVGVWSMPVDGGEPRLDFPLEQGILVWWTPAPSGIYLCWHESTVDRTYVVEYLSADGLVRRRVAELESRADTDFVYDPTSDSLLFSRFERHEADILAIRDY